MIQRIQTVFLFLAAIAAMGLYFFPLAGIYSAEGTYMFYVDRFENMVPGTESIFNDMALIPLAVINLAIAVMAIVTIFFYKKRHLQLRLVRLTIFLDLVMIGLIFFLYGKMIDSALGVQPTYLEEVGSYFPLVVFVFLFLANRFIVKDEKLIRATDRLR